MISQRLQDAINDQIKWEFYSAHMYLAMAAYCADQDLPGFENFFKVQAEEEKFHAMKFFDYVNERNGRVIIHGLDEPPNQFDSILDVFQKSYHHEQVVTSRIYNLMNIATEEKEHATISFLNWYVDEQVEEESSFNGIIKKLGRIGDNAAALYDLDTQLAARVFVPPPAA